MTGVSTKFKTDNLNYVSFPSGRFVDSRLEEEFQKLRSLRFWTGLLAGVTLALAYSYPALALVLLSEIARVLLVDLLGQTRYFLGFADLLAISLRLPLLLESPWSLFAVQFPLFWVAHQRAVALKLADHVRSLSLLSCLTMLSLLPLGFPSLGLILVLHLSAVSWYQSHLLPDILAARIHWLAGRTCPAALLLFDLAKQPPHFCSPAGRPEPSMVFLLGPARAGTTFLCKELAARLPLATLQTWQVAQWTRIQGRPRDSPEAHPDPCIEPLLEALGQYTRVIDSLPAGPHGQEEFGQLITGSHLSAANIDELRSLAQTLVELSGTPHVLLKNPLDTGLVSPALYRAAFPTAKFLYIHRSFAEVWRSQFTLLRLCTGPTRPLVPSSLLAPPPRVLVPVIAFFEGFASLFGQPVLHGFLMALSLLDVGLRGRALKRNLASAQPALLCLSYEELCAEPEACLQRISAFLELPLRPGEPAKVRPRRQQPVRPLARTILNWLTGGDEMPVLPNS